MITKVVHNTKLSNELYEMQLALAPFDVKAFAPGKFAHIQLPKGLHLLRRPFSIAYIDEEACVFGLYYKCVGDGTRILSSIQPGAELDVLAPLGNPFTVPDTVGTLCLIGGGVGIAPLLYAAQSWHAKCDMQAYLGCAKEADFFGLSRFEALCPVHLSTQDGSLGEKGLVTDLVRAQWNGKKPDLVLSCGPELMLRAVQALCAEYKVRAQLSLEQRMGCGTGACLVCSAQIRGAGRTHTQYSPSEACGCGHAPEQTNYIRVCKDGPVVDAEDIIFE